VNKTTNYTYNPTNYCVSQTAETRSDGHIKRTVLKYPNDFPKTVCDSLTYLHILNPVIVDSTYVDSKFLEWVKTNYISQHGGFYQPQYGGVLKPYSIENQIGNNASKIRIQYAKYDSHYNPVYVIQNEAINEVYLWSYNYQYPVVKIEGLTYAQVTNIFPQTSMDILASTPNPTADMLNNIRSAFAGQTALITTYTYQPLIGISTATAPNGVVTTYKYDTFNRLWYVNDNDGNNILNNQYHYGNH
jgi:YD repeat-containing protein